jgi:hypothetical protein
VSDYPDKFLFYLEEPLIFEQMERIYSEAKAKIPYLEFSSYMDQDIQESFDRQLGFKRIEEERHIPLADQRPLWQMRYDENVEIYIDYIKGMGDEGPYLRSGERQILVTFHQREFLPFAELVWERPGFGYALFPLVRIIAEVSNAFLGIYGNKVGFDYYHGPWSARPRGMVYLKGMLKWGNDKAWASFYLDEELVRAIGEDVVLRYAGFIQRTSTGGLFIERNGLPLFGGTSEEDPEVGKVKDVIYRERIYPAIVERLRREYRYDEDDRPL